MADQVTKQGGAAIAALEAALERKRGLLVQIEKSIETVTAELGNAQYSHSVMAAEIAEIEAAIERLTNG